MSRLSKRLKLCAVVGYVHEKQRVLIIDELPEFGLRINECEYYLEHHPRNHEDVRPESRLSRHLRRVEIQIGVFSWVGWDLDSRRIVELPNPSNRVRHTVNVITGFFWTQQGKLTADDVRPDVTFRREDVEGKFHLYGVRPKIP